MNDRQVNELFAILQWVIGDGRRYFREEADTHETNAHQQLVSVYDDLTTEQLERHRTTGTEVHQYVHARPIDNGTPTLLPVLKFNCTRQDEGLTLRLQAGLFALERDDSPAITSSSGWRFETPSSWDPHDDKAGGNPPKRQRRARKSTGRVDEPEPTGASGTHEYFHAQFIPGFDKSKNFVSVIAPFNPLQPAFRLDAWNAPSLAIAGLVSLYGLHPKLDELHHTDGILPTTRSPLSSVKDDTAGRTQGHRW